MEELLEPVGASVAVGRALARLRADRAEAGAADQAEAGAADRAEAGAADRAEAGAPVPPPAEAVTRASPAARRAAAAHGIALSQVAGTGPDGAVTLADVERAAERGPAAARADRAEALHRATGALMARSKREIPHYYLEHRVDVGRAVELVQRANEERAVTSRLVLTPLLLRAVALAAREVPETNGRWEGDRFAPASAVHVGLAISLRGGGSSPRPSTTSTGSRSTR